MTSPKTRVLHVCQREHLRQLRDQALRGSGYQVDSAADTRQGLSLAASREYDLVLIDVESDAQVAHAEDFCEHVRKAHPEVVIGFACNWQVSQLSHCPDEVIRTEFNPEAFVSGVRTMLKPN
jgi:DNA-binding response OmpR family regulator